MWASYRTDGSLRDLWLRPPGRAFHFTLLVLAVFTLWSVSVPGWYFGGAMLSCLVWILAAVIWAARITARNFLLVRGAPDPHPGRWRAWAVAPLLTGITLAVVLVGLPLRLRFTASRAALEGVAREAMSSTPYGEDWSSSDKLRVGWFDVSYRDAIPGGVRFWIEGAGFPLEPAGVAYAPGGVPPDGRFGWYWPLNDAWYGFSIAF